MNSGLTKANRLTSAATSAVGTGHYNHTYVYNAIGNITSNAGNSYTYGDAAHKHAVTAAFGNTYGYDANGNQTTRTIGGITYTFTYDYENRVTAIAGGSTSASFVYDASGMRVKGTVNGVTTVYIGGVYEYQAGATTHYYDGNAIRRTGYAADNGVTYLLQDHLKSSSKVINQNGTLNSQNFYYPFGGNRGGAAFSGVTTKRFTGQYHEKDLPGGEGISYYRARWYDAQIGRFTSADTVTPDVTNPQAFNRYSYVYNNPLLYTDSTGHCVDGISTVICIGAGVGGVVGGGWYLANEAWYGEIDLSVGLVWSQDSWVPGLDAGDDWWGLGTAAVTGAAAGALIPLGGAFGTAVGAAGTSMGIGMAGNLVADHTTNSLTGQPFSYGQHLFAGATGAAGGLATAGVGQWVGTVATTGSKFANTAIVVGAKGVTSGVIDGTSSYVTGAINGKGSWSSLPSDIAWGIAGEGFGLYTSFGSAQMKRELSRNIWDATFGAQYKFMEATSKQMVTMIGPPAPYKPVRPSIPMLGSVTNQSRLQ